MTDFHVAGEVLKVDESLGLVMGYAIVCTDAGEPYFDKQGDHVPEDAMLKASCDFMQHSRVARDMHSGADQGTVVLAWPMTTEVAKAFGQEAVKTDLGNGAEVDLFDALRAKFRSDAIKRIDQGVAGADIRHEVVHEGDTCGRVIYDAKNRRAWRNSYVDKLRNDQLAANADHAVLATKVFGQGRQRPHPADGTSGCSNTVRVALSRLSGGQAYFVEIRLTRGRRFGADVLAKRPVDPAVVPHGLDRQIRSVALDRSHRAIHGLADGRLSCLP